jgi:hypothetical protein
MGQHWVLYISKMDGIIEEALKHCVRASLQNMLKALQGDETAGPTQILKVSTTIMNNSVSLNTN